MLQILQTVWEYYVFFFVVGLFIPAFTHPIETIMAIYTVLTIVLCLEAY